MKDEEMAEEYAEEKVSNLDECRTKDLMRSVCKDGFLAGLKAGRPQWHDLRKDKNDLPKKTDEYLVYRISGYGSKSTELIQYNSERHFWCVEHQNDVIKWCEIPTFDKE